MRGMIIGGNSKYEPRLKRWQNFNFSTSDSEKNFAQGNTNNILSGLF